MFKEGQLAEKDPIETKREKYELLCGGKPDCFYVLGQGVVENPKSDKSPLKSASYAAVDSDGLILAGKARVIAAAELAGSFQDASVVTNSRGKMDEENVVSLAKVVSQELQNLGVDEGRIVLQESPYSTFSELTELIKLIVDNDWKNIVILTNEYQIPRCKAMFERLDSLKDPNGESEKPDFKAALETFKAMEVSVNFVSAEDILPIRSQHYGPLIEKVKQSKEWRERNRIEQDGTEQIIKGEYWKELPEHFVRPEDLG